MKKLTFNYESAKSFIKEQEIEFMKIQTEAMVQSLISKTGPGNDFLGWIDLPINYDKEEFIRIKKAADKIKSDSEILIVIGIGGSYLGSKAAIEFIGGTFFNTKSKKERNAPEIYFAGTNISGTYMTELLQHIGNRDFSINVISKSGTTTEPAIAFRILKNKLEEKYGKEEARKRIYATTDKKKGALKQLSEKETYETFVVPDDVGGRFTVLTAVGLLPIASAGIDIDLLMEGAKDARLEYSKPFDENDCYKYAAIRNILHKKGKDIEMLINYEPRVHYIAEWWKQLFGESEGKDGKGIFPASADFSTDLHSLGQYIQDGKRIIFETLIEIEKPQYDITLGLETEDLDELNYLNGKGMDYVNKQAALGTILAHEDGGVPTLKITIPEPNPYYLGYLFYFFEKACGVSGYLLGINPFDQPGVEDYKRNMFALLEKPGFEKESKMIKEKLK